MSGEMIYSNYDVDSVDFVDFVDYVFDAIFIYLNYIFDQLFYQIPIKSEKETKEDRP